MAGEVHATVSSEPVSDNVSERTISPDVLALYSETGSVARAILEWRHKVVMLYVLSLGAIGSAVFWLQDHHQFNLAPLPTAVGAVIVSFLAIMDNTNATVLKACYRVGDGIERRVLRLDGGIYSALLERSKRKRAFTYSRVLRVLYVGTAVALVAATALLW